MKKSIFLHKLDAINYKNLYKLWKVEQIRVHQDIKNKGYNYILSVISSIMRRFFYMYKRIKSK